MEMWLRQANDAFRFPVFPSSFEINGNINTNTSNVLKLGEIIVCGGVGLRTTEVTSFFPSQEYHFCNYKGFPQPYDCVEKLKKWMEQGLILRYIITETNINMEVIIENFKHGKQDGTNDVYFTLSLKEYKRIQIPSINSSDGKIEVVKNVPVTKGFETGKQKTHKVVKGDSLWSLAKKYYGNGDLWKKIYDANKKLIKNPDTIKDGWVLIIP
ncbi:TPA: LysM peptidoglycan-binding domain-containing protein [Clostridioides difficile]|uniref:LysM peptidoglycan-binding domain-containing protein n=1 Tax=Clostridioides difficile TaxID=1496 RepID=UPI00097FF3E6|nr:LysM peptidoglycan-binding domain-containing protein [Clostridioides difficile]SJW72527.1 lysM domain-containing protein [Clostridioides difficile]HBF9159668.1 LysM peptidoglycan-binding domain-containing protein [Clostridioides difficile]HBG4088896.1 LysM peptidoglycan-binding domain-containing protein [Clostridioides difficile]HBG4832928.1 LysM peptidoglycan-binding domain-containing protein [Clostridioides difficile]HCQ5720749.1 LysM peptidoglycan-binding domain-containing protein [Clost